MLDFSKNYFELFGLPVGFVIDGAELAGRYRDLQQKLHPDRFVSATAQEKRLSQQGASCINDAFETLKRPLPRARYLLELKGIEVDKGGGNTTDTAFLMEQMELRQELDEARNQADPHAVVAALMSRIDDHIKLFFRDLAARFEDDTAGSLEQAREILHKLGFLYRLRAQAEELELELDETL